MAATFSCAARKVQTALRPARRGISFAAAAGGAAAVTKEQERKLAIPKVLFKGMLPPGWNAIGPDRFAVAWFSGRAGGPRPLQPRRDRLFLRLPSAAGIHEDLAQPESDLLAGRGRGRFPARSRSAPACAAGALRRSHLDSRDGAICGHACTDDPSRPALLRRRAARKPVAAAHAGAALARYPHRAAGAGRYRRRHRHRSSALRFPAFGLEPDAQGHSRRQKLRRDKRAAAIPGAMRLLRLRAAFDRRDQRAS